MLSALVYLLRKRVKNFPLPTHHLIDAFHNRFANIRKSNSGVYRCRVTTDGGRGTYEQNYILNVQG